MRNIHRSISKNSEKLVFSMLAIISLIIVGFAIMRQINNSPEVVQARGKEICNNVQQVSIVDRFIGLKEKAKCR